MVIWNVIQTKSMFVVEYVLSADSLLIFITIPITSVFQKFITSVFKPHQRKLGTLIHWRQWTNVTCSFGVGIFPINCDVCRLHGFPRVLRSGKNRQLRHAAVLHERQRMDKTEPNLRVSHLRIFLSSESCRLQHPLVTDCINACCY